MYLNIFKACNIFIEAKQSEMEFNTILVAI